MDGHDSEPLFGEDVYSLLRDDSLLQRTGSTNFASLLDSSNSVGPETSLNQPLQQRTQENTQLKEETFQPPSEVPVASCTQQDMNEEVETDIKVESKIKQEQCVVYHIAANHLGSQGKVLFVTPTMNGQQQLQIQQQSVQMQQQPVQMQQQPVQMQPTPPPQEMEQQPQLSWDAIDQENEESIPLPSTAAELINRDSFMALVEESSSLLPDSTFCVVPSLQPWAGKYNFNISLPTDNKDRNKWCYSEDIKKLYLCPNVAVPVNITMSKWVDANITITPVFQQSQYRMDAVTRCYNCKNTKNCDPQLSDFVVQVEGEGCIYEVAQDRPIVKVPLQFPPPGEEVSTLLVKLMCLTSCVGGPNRRPFCLVLTLRCNITGTEIGRQIIDVKCCKCPSRDMTNDEKATCPDVGAARSEEGKLVKIRKLSTQIKTKPKRNKPTIKTEPGTDTRYINVAVPIEFELQVKSYVNGLIAEQILRRNHPNLLLYPEDDN